MLIQEKVAAVIVTNGVHDDLFKCVDSVINQSYTPDQIYIVNVSDSANELTQVIDGANSGLAKANINTSIILFNAPKAKNFSVAVNALIDSTTFNTENDWIWLLHDDASADSKTLQALLEEVVISETIGVAGAKQIDPSTNTLINVGYTTSFQGKRASLIGKEQVDQGQYAKIEDVLSVSLNGALIKRELFTKIGGLNEKLSNNSSLEFCRRMHLSGHRVIVGSGATVYHQRKTFNPHNHYTLTRDDLIYRLSTCRSIFLLPLFLYLLIANIINAIKQLYSDNRGSFAVLTGGLTGLFSWHTIAHTRILSMRAKIVPRSALYSLLATPKQMRLIRHDEKLDLAATLWEDFQPTLLQSNTLHTLAKKRRVAFVLTVLLLFGLTLLHFHAYFGALLSGGHFESDSLPASGANLSDIFTAWSSGFSDSNFGYNAPNNGVLLPIMLLTVFTGSVALTLNIIVGLSLLLCGICAWVASGGATRNNSARVLAVLIWVSLPSFTNSLDRGDISTIITHIMLPLLPYVLARGLGKVATDLDIGLPKLSYNFPLYGILLAIICAATPVLIVPLVGITLIAGFWNRRFWFALIPVFVLNFWLFAWMITNLQNNSWQILFGNVIQGSSSNRGTFQIIFGSGDITSLKVVICCGLIIISALYLLKATRTARIVLTRFCWLLAVLSFATAILIERNTEFDASPLISVTYLCLIVTILIFLNQRLMFARNSLIIYALVGACVVFLSVVYVLFENPQTLRAVNDYSIPAVAEKISSDKGNPRILVLDENDKGVIYSVVHSRTSDFINKSTAAQISVENSELSESDVALRSAVADMLAAPSQTALQSIEKLGISAIFVPEISKEDWRNAHDKLLQAIDGTPGIVRIIEGNDKAFWRIPNFLTDKETIAWDNSKAETAYNSPIRYLFIFFAGFTFILFIILSLPFGKRKVVKYDV